MRTSCGEYARAVTIASMPRPGGVVRTLANVPSNPNHLCYLAGGFCDVVTVCRGWSRHPQVSHCFQSVMVHSRAIITIHIGPTLGALSP